MYGKRKRACFMKMTLQKSFVPCAKGEHMERSQAKEGKIELSAACDGLLKINNNGLKAVNGFGQMMIATATEILPLKKVIN